MGEGDTLLNAVIGAAVTVVLSFTGFSPLIGGGVAGYLQRGTRTGGAKVGAIAGALAFLPFVFLVVVALGFFTMVGTGVGMPGGFELLVISFILLPLVFLWNVGLGAAGGYLGVYVREELGGSNGRPAAT